MVRASSPAEEREHPLCGRLPAHHPSGRRPINPGKGEIRRFPATPEMVIENQALGSRNSPSLESLS